MTFRTVFNAVIIALTLICFCACPQGDGPQGGTKSGQAGGSSQQNLQGGWPMQDVNWQGNRVLDYSGPVAPELLWQVKLVESEPQFSIYTQPVTDNEGTCFIAINSGYMIKTEFTPELEPGYVAVVDRMGNIVRRVEFEGFSQSGPAVLPNGNAVIVSSYYTELSKQTPDSPDSFVMIKAVDKQGAVVWDKRISSTYEYAKVLYDPEFNLYINLEAYRENFDPGVDVQSNLLVYGMDGGQITDRYIGSAYMDVLVPGFDNRLLTFQKGRDELVITDTKTWESTSKPAELDIAPYRILPTKDMLLCLEIFGDYFEYSEEEDVMVFNKDTHTTINALNWDGGLAWSVDVPDGAFPVGLFESDVDFMVLAMHYNTPDKLTMEEWDRYVEQVDFAVLKLSRHGELVQSSKLELGYIFWAVIDARGSFIAARLNGLTAFTAEGEVLWQIDTDYMPSEFSIDRDGTIRVAGMDGVLYCYGDPGVLDKPVDWQVGE